MDLLQISEFLLKVPLLFEVKWENLFDAIIVVFADYEKCLHRLMNRDGIEMAAAIKELESQLSLREKVMRADHVIDNSGSISDTSNQVHHLAVHLKNNTEPKEKKLDSTK